jgi:ParB-like chromosome segregation protein Spo0J
MNYLKLTELKKLPNNPRTIKEKDFKKLVDSIKKFGVIK